MLPMPEPRDADVAAPDQQIHHAPRLLPTRPLPMPLPGASADSSLDPKRILAALKYHWFLFLVLGSLVGGGLGAAAYELLPAKYTTTALLRVNSSNVGLLGSDPNSRSSEFLTFLRTQADAIRSENVLRAALRDSKIGNTETLKAPDDPVRWLQDNLVIEFSEHSEIMKVSLTCENAQESADIINAVDAAYMKEVVFNDQLKKKSVLDTLDRSRAQMEEKVKNLKVALELKRKKDVPTAAPPLAPAAALPPPGGALPPPGAPVMPAIEAPAQKVTVGTAEYARMNEELRRAELNFILVQQQIQTLQAQKAKAEKQEIPAEELEDYFARDPDLRLLKDKSERADKTYQFLRNSYTDPNHPDARDGKAKAERARAAIEEYKATKKGELNRQVQSRDRRLIEAEIDKVNADLAARDLVRKTLKAQIDSSSPEGKPSVPGTNGGLAIKDKSPVDYDLDEGSLVYAISTYEDLLKRQNQQGVEIQNAKPRVEEWQRAAVPIKKEMKKQIIFTAFAALLGFAMVGACITMYEGRVNRLYSTSDLDRNPAMHVVGVLPEIGSVDPVAGADPAKLKADPFSEGVEKVRLMLGRHFMGKPAQTILISSASEGEGKTTLAGHLAVSMTRGDRKTVLVDGNLRHPGLHEHLGLPAAPGVCDLLRGDASTQDVVQRTGINNLFFLPAGAFDATAQQALGRDRFRRIIDKLRQDYDYVIIDSHDLSTVADTYQMGQHCDAVIVCARKYVSRKPDVEQAYQKVCELGVPHSGVIFLGEAA